MALESIPAIHRKPPILKGSSLVISVDFNNGAVVICRPLLVHYKSFSAGLIIINFNGGQIGYKKKKQFRQNSSLIKRQ